MTWKLIVNGSVSLPIHDDGPHLLQYYTSLQRIALVLAGKSAGVRHIIDARRAVEQYDRGTSEGRSVGHSWICPYRHHTIISIRIRNDRLRRGAHLSSC